MKNFKLEYLITPAIIIGGLALIKLVDKLSNGATTSEDILVFPGGVTESQKAAIQREYDSTLIYAADSNDDYDRHYYKAMCRKIKAGKYKIDGDEIFIKFKDADGDEVDESIEL